MPITFDGVNGLSSTGNVATTGYFVGDSTYLTNVYTVATLPAVPVIGMRAIVTDALAPSFLSPVAGSGVTVCPVFYDGGAWIVG